MNDGQAKNPFLIAGYEGSDYFCDRERETEKLLEAVNNGRNVTLLAARRIGKTGLIKHLFGKLREKGDWNVVYVDIYATQNLAEFARKFAAAVIGSMDSSMEKALLAATAFFKSFRPGISIDPLTGAPAYSFAIQPMQIEASLKECFDYLATIARDRRVKGVTGADFLSRHDLGGASSVHLSLNKLLEDELLYEDADGYVVYDRLFGMWLARMS